MRHLPLLLLLTAAAAALLAPLHPPAASAQLEQTPILGEPVVVTPLVTPAAPPEQAPDTGLAPTVAPSAPTSSAVAAPAAPDACEPNDTPARACALSLDAVSGPFTIVPEADQDFYQLDIPQEPSIQTVVTVRATAGLDLILSARQGEALLASGAYSLTLAPEVAGSVVLRVENRDPRPAAGEQYRVEVRREIAPPRQGEDGAGDVPAPDPLENNWSFDTAAPIAVGVVYDLSFACPEQRPDACPGGDHDYLLVPVKAGVTYLLTTFDLDPGVDTVLELFWGLTTAAVAGNDDYAPGGTLSALHWTAPSDDLLVVRVAPRNGGLAQHLAGAKTGYRLAVAPQASELASKLEATIRTQANVPSPTPTAAAVAAAPLGPPNGGGGSAGASAPPTGAGGVIAQESITAGPGMIIRETVLRREPSEGSTALTTLAPETQVTVRGPVSGLWVSVETDASILPGWVRFSDLQRLAKPTASTAPAPNSTAASADSHQPGAAERPTPSPAAAAVGTGGSSYDTASQVIATELDPALPAPPPPPVARVPFALSVAVVATDRPPTGGSALGFATPTPDMRHPAARVRLQLINVFGDVLAEGLTDAQGTTQLRRDVRPGDALTVRIPAWGIESPLAANQTSLIVTIPEGTR